MRLEKALAISRKELKEIARNKYFVVLMGIFTIVFPVLFGSLHSFFGGPQHLLQFMFNIDLLMLGLFGACISGNIATQSFTGEKKSKTLETLLASPISDFELFIAKTISTVVPGILCGYFSIIIFLAIVQIRFAYHDLPLPLNPAQAAFIIVLIPLLALMFCGLMVTGSGAFSSLIPWKAVMITIAMITSVAAVLFFLFRSVFMAGFSLLPAAITLIVLFLMTLVTLYLGARMFRRENILVVM